jgi:hypothetical protein
MTEQLEKAVAGLMGLELEALTTEQLEMLRRVVAYEADQLAYFVKQIERELGYRE